MASRAERTVTKEAVDDEETMASRPERTEEVVVGAAAVGAAAGAIVAPVVAGAAVEAAGFLAGGIAAGSMGVSMMAAEAVAGGGGVAAGGTVATLQSIGAAGGFLGVATVGAALIGAGAGAAAWGLQKTVFDPFPGHKHREESVLEGVKKHRWLVVTEEGPSNVQCYSFVLESDARMFISKEGFGHLARILFDDTATEVSAAGWDLFGWCPAHDTIRDRVAWAKAELCTDDRFLSYPGLDSFPGDNADVICIKSGDLTPAFNHCADRDDLNGFAYFQGKAYFRSQSRKDLDKHKEPLPHEVILCLQKE